MLLQTMKTLQENKGLTTAHFVIKSSLIPYYDYLTTILHSSLVARRNVSIVLTSS